MNKILLIFPFLLLCTENPAINMIKVPPLPVEEYSVVEYVCKTHYSYHYPPAVQWFLDNKLLLHGVNDENYTSPEESHMSNSTLRIRVKRQMNNKNIKCALKDDYTILATHNLNVKCK